MVFSPPKDQVRVPSTPLCGLHVEQVPSHQPLSQQPSRHVREQSCHHKVNDLFLIPGWVPIQKMGRMRSRHCACIQALRNKGVGRMVCHCY